MAVLDTEQELTEKREVSISNNNIYLYKYNSKVNANPTPY